MNVAIHALPLVLIRVLSIALLLAGSPLRGQELTGDFYVDPMDLLELGVYWRPTSRTQDFLHADINSDGTVDEEDLVRLLSAWHSVQLPRSFSYDWGASSADLRVEPSPRVSMPELRVYSLSGEGTPDNTGDVYLDVPDVTAPAYCVIANASDESILFGLLLSEGAANEGKSVTTKAKESFTLDKYVKDTGTPVPAGAESTALVLCTLTPLLWGTSAAERIAFTSYLKTRGDFVDLVAMIAELYKTDPNHVLDDSKYPQVYEKAALVSVYALREWSGKAGKGYGKEQVSKADLNIWLEDDPQGNQPKIRFMSQATVYYGAGIYPCGSEQMRQSAFLVKRIQSVINFHMSWPPFTSGVPVYTDVDLPDGHFIAKLYKGLNVSNAASLSPFTPQGLAAWANTAALCFVILDVITGVEMPGLDEEDIESFSLLLGGAKEVVALSAALAEGNTKKTVSAALSVVVNHTDDLIKWAGPRVLKKMGKEAAEKLAQSAAKLAGRVLAIWDIANEGVPFVVDLVKAPSSAELAICQENGRLNLACSTVDCPNSPPVIVGKPSLSLVLPVAVGKTWIYNMTVDDADGDEVSVEIVSGPADRIQIVPLGGNKFQLRFVPVEADVPGAYASIPFTVEISDGKGGTDQLSLTIRVSRGSGSNQPPVITTNPQLSVMIGNEYLQSLAAEDPEGDSIEFTLLRAPSGMKLFDPAGPNPRLYWKPRLDQLGSFQVVVEAKDYATVLGTRYPISHPGVNNPGSKMDFSVIVSTTLIQEVIEIPLPNLAVGARPLRLVRIPAGAFKMGNPGTERDVRFGEPNEYPNHTVTFNYDFYMSETEVTQAQWETIMQSNPASGAGTGQNFPVYNVSWNAVTQTDGFLERLNALGHGTFRLPSEAEWEYACRGSNTNPNRYSPFSFGDDLTIADIDICQFSNIFDQYMSWCANGGMNPVSSKSPNDYGLFDMHGNVWEWCEDRWHDTYTGAPKNGSVWEEGGGAERVFRGGYWWGAAGASRSANRNKATPTFADFTIGLRLVWSNGIPPAPFYDFGACPFECCIYGDWTARTHVDVRANYTMESAISFSLENGDPVTGLTGVVITDKPGRLRAKDAIDLGQVVQPGEIVFIYTYFGEGFWKVWFGGGFVGEVGYPFTDTDQFELLEYPVQTWWAEIRDSQGRTGWVREPDFDGMDACGRR